MAGGTISFGLVNIPVKVYSASESTNKISFNQLHAEKKTRLKQQMFEPTTGETHLRHHVSPTGFYRGKKVVRTKGE